ncbi:GGDEF domain-containing protein [Chitiniphilus shinanonensis]|uniref:GGDEF domain-containing protein n=1 Tax=Chitiniphilus shinanonensis TaxID=553088 RepID=UPI003044046D
MNALSIDQKFRTGSLLIIGIALLLAGQLAWSNFERYRRNLDNLHNLALYRAALEIANAASAERGPSGSLMDNNGTASEAWRQRLAKARTRTDLALDRVATLLAQHPESLPAAGDTLAEVRPALDQMRMLIDSLAAQPLSERSEIEIAYAIERMFSVVDRVKPLIVEIGNHATKADRNVADAVLMAQMVGNMREYAGRLGSLFIAPLATRQPIELALRRRIGNMRGRLDELNGLLARQVGGYWDRPEIEQARFAISQQYFGGNEQFLESILRVGRHSGDYPLSAAGFVQRYVPTMQAMEQLKHLIIETGAEAAAAERDAACWGMLFALLQGIAIAGVLALLLRTGRCRLLRPLLQARRAIVELAHGDTAPITRPHAGREVGELFDAIDILRACQQQRDLLEKRLTALTRQLKQQAETDPLTGVSNRRALVELGEQLLLGASLGGGQMGLLLFDIDHFKRVNDLYGHPAGDEVLRVVAQRVRAACRSEDNVGRFGGEEFTVLVPRTDQGAARVLAEKLRCLIAEVPIVLADGQSLTVTASFGIALSRAEDDWIALLAMADQALYLAKRNGRNRVESANDTAD